MRSMVLSKCPNQNCIWNFLTLMSIKPVAASRNLVVNVNSAEAAQSAVCCIAACVLLTSFRLMDKRPISKRLLSSFGFMSSVLLMHRVHVADSDVS